MKLFPELFCKRIFTGWDAPLLPAVVRSLVLRASGRSSLDLGEWIVALPTLQSVRRFETLLGEQSDAAGLNCIAPQVVTAGELPELLYRPRKPLAIEFEQTLAWASVLRSLPRESLRPLVPTPPEESAMSAWLELASTLRRVSTDLAAHGKSFMDVVAIAESGSERERWNLLAGLHARYLDELEQAGRSDLHDQRRRAAAREAIHSPRRIALVGTSDLNESVAQVLTEVDQQIISFIAAPESESERFDWLGRFRTESFLDLELPMGDHHLIAADDIADQVACVEEVITQWAAKHPPNQVTVGMTDPSQLVPSEMAIRQSGFAAYRQVGWTLDQTAVGKLLQLTVELVSRPTWRSLVALARHPDVLDVLADSSHSPDEVLTCLDQVMANHFPVDLFEPLPAEAVDRYPDAIQLVAKVKRLLADLLHPENGTSLKRLSHCSRSLLNWLDVVFKSPLKTQESRTKTTLAYTKARELLKRFASLSDRLDVPLTPAAAIETLCNRIGELRITLEPEPAATRVHGWLDLALDDSPAMLVIGLNHPFVPASVTSDPFLPGEMRSRLRVADNERRFARDLYAMRLMLSTRDDIRFIVGKKSADGTPTPPSRLLAATEADDLARRIRFLQAPRAASETVTDPVESIGTIDDGVAATVLPIPKVDVEECPVKAMSVTAFKSYLECPFRFYLRHVLKLRPIDDGSRELAANQFGDLVHGALEDFGLSDAKGESNESRVFDALQHHLHAFAKRHYGETCERSVTLQIRQAEERLRSVAAEQVKRIDEGWQIHAVEASVQPSTSRGITVDGRTMPLAGRFDRIDRHVDSGQWAILDYKTHGHKPEKKHLRKNPITGKQEWIDLQLPLYRLMIPDLEIHVDDPAGVQLGYFNVSDKPEETRINLAAFSEPLLAEAQALIEDCVRRIFRCDFEPTTGQVQYDDYGMILQTGVASRMLADLALEETEDEGVAV